jgi:hypothetical protein
MSFTKYIIVIVLSALTKIVCSQGTLVLFNPTPGSENSNVIKCSGKIISIDSQFVLLIYISVINNDTVSIEKNRFYYQAENGNAANVRLYLRKVIRRRFVHWYNEGYPHNDFFTDSETKIEVTIKHPHIDTIALDHIYPFEIGEYSIQAEIDYFYKGRKFYVWVNDIPFSVAHLPKKSRFNE